jgi:hypothetical protein
VLYSFDLTIPLGTLASAPAKLDAKLQAGVITHVRVIIPEGVAGLASSYVRRGAHQLYPSNPDGAFTGDGFPIEWDEQYELADEPTTLQLFGYSPNARFPHTITWQFEVMDLDQAQAVQATPGLLRRIADVLVGKA